MVARKSPAKDLHYHSLYISLIKPRPGLFERWIMLSSGEITVQWIAWFVLLTLIHWIAIYPVDSVIQPLNNWGQNAFHDS